MTTIKQLHFCRILVIEVVVNDFEVSFGYGEVNVMIKLIDDWKRC